jgi:hypothetical protein
MQIELNAWPYTPGLWILQVPCLALHLADKEIDCIRLRKLRGIAGELDMEPRGSLVFFL